MADRKAILYTPENVPEMGEALPEFLSRELARISIAISLLAAGYIEETFVEPNKPRTGLIKLADGTSWNPGGGRGIYYYDENTASWVKL